mmetsp:Transcript_16168/g.54145  ORF Transcript_16168/g.54145 Transcript_16168/m.54145 type:complete len:140 (+) Transcript_16168:1947-2366(+)
MIFEGIKSPARDKRLLEEGNGAGVQEWVGAKETGKLVGNVVDEAADASEAEGCMEVLEDAEPTKGKAVSNKEDEGAADDWIEGSKEDTVDADEEEEGCHEVRREEGAVAGAGAVARAENEVKVLVEGGGGGEEEESGTM